MFESNNKENGRFVKKPHRPWDGNLLQQTINNSEKAQATLNNNYNLNDPNYSNKTFDNKKLQSALDESQRHKEELLKNIHNNKSNVALSLGGFLQPTNMQIPNSSQNGQKINRLIHDLKSREQEITSITANLRIAEAIEKAEQAEAIRVTEENARISAEKRMKQAIEQVNIAASQLTIAIEKAQLAEQAQKEEERARRRTEIELNKYIEQMRTIEQKLKNEIEAKKAAEDKAQISLNQTIQTELARQDLESTKKKIEQEYADILEQLHKTELSKSTEELSKHELQQQFNRYQEITEHDKTILEKTISNFQFENSKLISGNDELRNQVIGLEELAKQQEQQINELNIKIMACKSHQQKLEQIIETEQNLRKLAEQKANSALASAAKADLARQEAEKQKQITDERAKRIAAHANNTVMTFLDSTSKHIINSKEEKELADNYIEDILK